MEKEKKQVVIDKIKICLMEIAIPSVISIVVSVLTVTLCIKLGIA
ncbi:MAG: hypothetical protein ACLVK5_00055 [Peptoniphilus senegalensis]